MSREVEEKELVMMEIEEEEEERRTSTTSSGGNSRRRRRRRRGEEEEEEEEVVRRLEDNVDLPIPMVGGGGSLRVLLLEGDDSTRHIITALLRKCHYKVTAVCDGLKAWEILKERPHSVDLVLTEVELSLISGISLLSMIMGHESCKNIPVIMMSSNDSINMVFKCMLKGAADFLVKPVRKNELRNLWQHVWRKRTISDGHGGAKGHNDDNAKNRLEANPRKAKKSSGFLPLVEVNMECSEKGSDAESSCRRSDMEAESTYKQNSTEPEQIKCGGLSPLSDSLCQNDEERIQPNSSFLGKAIKDEDCSNMLGSEFTLFNGRCMANEQLLEEEHPCALVDATNEDMKPIGSIYDNSTTNGDQTCDQSTPPKQIIDLIGEINNQGQFGYGLGRKTSSSNNPNDATEVVFHGEDFSCKSSSSPMLELSLRRYPYGTVDKEKEKAWSTLNHSNSSPFSLYNGRPPVPPLSRIVNLEGEGEEFYSHSTKQIPDKGFGNSSNVLGCNGTTPNIEDVEPPSFGASSQDGNTVKSSPIRVISVSIPVGGMNFDIGARYHSGMQSIFYPDPSAHLLWNAFQIEERKAGHTSSSRQSDTKDFYSSHQHPHNQAPKSPILYQIEHMTAELRDKECHATSVTGDSANSSTCHGSASQIESNGLGRIFHVNNANNNAMKINNVTAELQNQEEKKPAELHRLNHREAALNKFRLKRKDRCFEKKVRYQSRKRLAEQRPRVKGQFVRHIQPGALLASAELSGSY